MQSAWIRVMGHWLPAKLRRAARVVVLDALDILDMSLGRRDPLVPPRKLIFVGGGDYKRIGDRFLGLFISPGGLRRSDQVVDIGCGCGRMSRPLAAYLDPLSGGRYLGLDVSAVGIEWCKQNITQRFPHFQFVHLDIFNAAYNPTGKGAAGTYALPVESESADFVVAVSLFTSMLPQDALHYLAEIARMLRPGGKLFLSLFLLNSESRRMIKAGKSALVFASPVSGGLSIDPGCPEGALACDEKLLLDGLAAVGMRVEGAINYGRWSGRIGPALTHEDVILAVRTCPSTLGTLGESHRVLG